jgi:hypothetical protein
LKLFSRLVVIFFLCFMQNKLKEIEIELAQRIYKLFLEKFDGNKSAFARASYCDETTRILNSFKSLTVSSTDKENMASMVKKIRGDKKPLKINLDNAETKAISTSQQSYDSRVANFDTLIKLVSSHTLYNPNEEELKIENLQAYHQALSDLNDIVNAAGNTIITIRKQRDDKLYKCEKNVTNLTKDIKSYLKSLGEAGQPYYKAVVRLKFSEMQ